MAWEWRISTSGKERMLNRTQPLDDKIKRLKWKRWLSSCFECVQIYNQNRYTSQVHTAYNLLLLQKLEGSELLLGETWTLQFVEAMQCTHYPKLVHKSVKVKFHYFWGLGKNHVTFCSGVVECCLKTFLEVFCQINLSLFVKLHSSQLFGSIVLCLLVACCVHDWCIPNILVHNLWFPWSHRHGLARAGEWTSSNEWTSHVSVKHALWCFLILFFCCCPHRCKSKLVWHARSRGF